MTDVTIGQYAGRIAKTKRVRVMVIMDRAGNCEVMGSSDTSEKDIEEILGFSCRDFGPRPWSCFWTDIDVPYPISGEPVS
jgi:hypothetical protein